MLTVECPIVPTNRKLLTRNSTKFALKLPNLDTLLDSKIPKISRHRNVTRIFLEFLESEKVSKFGNFGAKLVINLSLRED